MSYEQGIEKAVRAEAGQWASLETGQTLDEWMTVYPELVKTWRRSFVRQVEAFLSAQPTIQWCEVHESPQTDDRTCAAIQVWMGWINDQPDEPKEFADSPMECEFRVVRIVERETP